MQLIISIDESAGHLELQTDSPDIEPPEFARWLEVVAEIIRTQPNLLESMQKMQ